MLGQEGILWVGSKKAHSIFGKSLAMLSLTEWNYDQLTHWCGNAIFAGSFNRPCFAFLQDCFLQVQALEIKPAAPWQTSLDEIIAFQLCLPFCYSNLRAQIRPVISATDASEHGAGAAEARAFLPGIDESAAARIDENRMFMLGQGTALEQHVLCSVCLASLTNLRRLSCPVGCISNGLCSLECVLAHRAQCCRAIEEQPPAFAEVWCGPEAVLSQAVAAASVSVALPFDKLYPPPPLIRISSSHPAGDCSNDTMISPT